VLLLAVRPGGDWSLPEVPFGASDSAEAAVRRRLLNGGIAPRDARFLARARRGAGVIEYWATTSAELLASWEVPGVTRGWFSVMDAARLLHADGELVDLLSASPNTSLSAAAPSPTKRNE